MFSQLFHGGAAQPRAQSTLPAGINIGGLAVGFAAAMLIGLFVRDDFSYDGFIFPHNQHVYRVSSFRVVPGRSPIFVPVVSAGRGPAWMKLDFPGVQSAARLASEEVGFAPWRFRGERLQSPWADPEVFDVLPLRVFAGESTDGFGAAGRDRSDEANGTQVFRPRQSDRRRNDRDHRQHSMQVTAGAHGICRRTPHLKYRTICIRARRVLAPCIARRHAGTGDPETLEYLDLHPLVCHGIDR